MSTATLRRQAYDFIYGKLVRGEYKPGQRLANRALAKELGISFIPIREAISQLASEGLLEHRPKVGAFVINASRQEIEELYDYREALETYVVEQLAGRITPADLAELDRHQKQLRAISAEVDKSGNAVMTPVQNERWAATDVSFHMTLLTAHGNRRTIKAVGELRLMAHIFARPRSDRMLVEAERVIGEHEAVIVALRKGDAQQARQAMSHHLRRGREVAIHLFDRERARSAADNSMSVEPAT